MDARSGLCSGCGRTLEEIARWGSMAEDERLEIMQELPQRLSHAGLSGPRSSLPPGSG
jgi:predicted Fe-S protein YdhL (DUF1289 family)